MGRSNYARCKECGVERKDGADISWEGYCAVCGPKIRDQANDDMHFHRGPYFLRWRRAMAASVGGVLVDDVLDAE